MSPTLKSEVISQADIPESAMLHDLPLVLIVDDEHAIADTLSIILSRSGFATRTAYSAEEALDIFDDVDPDLLISDVVMSGLTGVELAIRTTHLLPSCKIILFSGQAATADLLVEARKVGHSFTTLAKPVHPVEMLRCISKTLAYPIHGISSPTPMETIM